MRANGVALALVMALYLLHQDFWLWKAKTLLFGFLPAGLAYHMGYSLLASLTLWALVRFAWPEHLEEKDPPGP